MSFNDLTKQRFHFVGICGIGMSALAYMAKRAGCFVQGSDLSKKNLPSLNDIAIYTHEAAFDHLANLDGIVYSSAIKHSHPLLKKAQTLNIPLIHRSELLAILTKDLTNIIVCGAHGKTTVSSLCGHVLTQLGCDPTIINGGIMQNFDTNAVYGKSKMCVVEADESDRSFLNLDPNIAIITNIDKEHLESYENFDDLKNSFNIFFKKAAQKGVGIGCFDDSIVRTIMDKAQEQGLSTLSYGIQGGDVQAHNIRYFAKGMTFDLSIKGEAKVLDYKDIFIPLLGQHNVYNALAVIAVCLWMKFDLKSIACGFMSFTGTKRRFNILTSTPSSTIVIDDYAHHPTEINAVLDTVTRCFPNKRLVCVFEPHRYSRVSTLKDDFIDVLKKAQCLLVLPLYGAGENSIEGTDEKLFLKIHPKTYAVQGAHDIYQKIHPNDVVLCVGAGKVSSIAHELVTLINTN